MKCSKISGMCIPFFYISAQCTLSNHRKKTRKCSSPFIFILTSLTLTSGKNPKISLTLVILSNFSIPCNCLLCYIYLQSQFSSKNLNLTSSFSFKCCCFFLGQFGVRTEGIQEALLKVRDLPENAERLAKMKQVMKAVSH